MRLVADSPTVESAVDRYRLAVPRVLQQARVWVVWRFEPASEAGKKPLKIPYYVSGARRAGIQGATEDVAQLATFDGALAAFASGSYTGLGIAHVPGCGFNSFDFDNCIDEHGKIDPELEALVRASETYVEISPSGRGLRMIARGSLPSIKRIHEGGYNIEVFGETGFVTVTARTIAGDDVNALPAPVLDTLRNWMQADSAAPTRSRAEQLENVKGLDAVFQRLRQQSRIKKEWPDGKVSIRCPFEHEHTSGPGISDTVYFLPNTHGYANGHFQCLHAHCAHRTDLDFNSAIGVLPVSLDFLRTAEEGPIVNAVEFISGWVPTEYVLKGVLVRGFLHALTGHSNAGKTAICLKVAVCVAMGIPFGNRPCKQATVVYLAGENPDDIRCRVIALIQDMRLDPQELAKHLFILPHAFPIAQHAEYLKKQLTKLGELGLVIVDTRAAYSAAEDENDNAQAMLDARATRELTMLPGRPAVLVPNHPTHGAKPPEMRPRGGSSYFGEFDMNFNAWNADGVITWAGHKKRGAEFEPITMALRPFTLSGYVQPDGDPITAIVVDVTNEAQAEQIAIQTESDENRLLEVIAANPRASLRRLSDCLGWPGGKMRVSRLLKQLKEDKLVRTFRRQLLLTESGKKELKSNG